LLFRRFKAILDELHNQPDRNPMKRIILVTLVCLVSTLHAQSPKYPATRTVDQVDTYHGTAVADPYRWLEDDSSPETASWVAAQNAVTQAYLDKIPFRSALKVRLEELYNYPKYSAPSRKGNTFFFYKNDGLQNQSVLYMQKGLDGTPEVLIDPNRWAADGTCRLTAFEVSGDGKLAAYGISRSGSDWVDYCVMDMATRMTSADTVHWVKVSGLSWYKEGFFYSRYDAPAPGKELSSKNENHKVYYHRVGTPQSADMLVYADPAHPQRFNFLGTTEDERFALLSVSDRGTGKKGNSLFFRRLGEPDTVFHPIVPDITDDEYGVIGNIGDVLYIRTNESAPNGKVVTYHTKPGEGARWKTILPERPEPLRSATLAGGKLFILRTKDVVSQAEVYSTGGTLENEIALPGPGAASGLNGEHDDAFVFYTFSSFTVPPSIYRYDIATRVNSVFRTSPIPGYDASQYETEEVFYPSKDGTKIPMFLVHRKGLKLNGKNPTLLYGYGGFNITMAPAFSPLRIALLEQGFVYASANLRGGGEYGETWHDAGTKLKKQNVFDDFISAAEWLIAQKYTSPSRLAINGGSNGGLLVGAVMNQRPDLFRVAVPQVGVMDMLRFHKFTIGWNWIPDYGSSDDAAEFKALYAYSPLHNIREGVDYPATLITTADHDDRVVPAHSFKYAATLQAKASPKAPALIRIETKSGHGASNTTKSIEMAADIYAFIMNNLGVTPVMR
jgi:prolyl oligopeptidase